MDRRRRDGLELEDNIDDVKVKVHVGDFRKKSKRQSETLSKRLDFQSRRHKEAGDFDTSRSMATLQKN